MPEKKQPFLLEPQYIRNQIGIPELFSSKCIMQGNVFLGFLDGFPKMVLI